MNRILLLFVGIAMIPFFISCRSTRNLKTAIAKKDTTVITNLPSDHGHEDSIAFIQENYRRVQANRITCTTFSAKIDVNYQDADGKNYDLTAHLRMYRDSVIWVSVTAILNIEVLRAYITRDSVWILDKQNKSFTARSVSYLQEVTNLPLELSSLEDLLLGNPVFLDSNITSYSQSNNTISLLNNGHFFKNLLTIGETDKLIQSIKLDDLDETRNRTCYITYSDYDDKKGVNFSTKRNISVSEKKKLDIKMDFRQYDFNETLSFPFAIPKNYKPN